MLYEEILKGCELYHENEDGRSYDAAYVSYAYDKDPAKWDKHETLDYYEVERVIRFANKWKSRMPSFPKNVERMLIGLENALPDLNLLRNDTLLEVDFERLISFDRLISREMTVSELISKSFGTIAGASRRRDGVAVYTSVGTSKILNAAVNSELFVMWDNAIQDGYRIGNGGYTYANIFLPKMQELGQQAVNELMQVEDLSRGDAINFFTNHCKNKNSLAKIIDEYNYARFTL